MQFRISQLSRLVNVSSVLKTAKTFNFKIRQEVSEIPAPVGRINGQQFYTSVKAQSTESRLGQESTSSLIFCYQLQFYPVFKVQFLPLIQEASLYPVYRDSHFLEFLGTQNLKATIKSSKFFCWYVHLMNTNDMMCVFRMFYSLLGARTEGNKACELSAVSVANTSGGGMASQSMGLPGGRHWMEMPLLVFPCVWFPK